MILVEKCFGNEISDLIGNLLRWGVHVDGRIYLRAFYHPRQTAELKRKMGATLKNTKGLLNENQFRAVSRLSNVTKYREKGLIKPIGYGLTNSGASPFYHPRQIAKLKKVLGITLKTTKGLLSEGEIRKKPGLSSVLMMHTAATLQMHYRFWKNMALPAGL